VYEVSVFAMVNSLLVIAHPDDEAMFFSPMLYNLNQYTNYNVYLLCMSSGNFAGLGETRKRELEKSCSLFGIKSYENNR